MNFDVLEFYIFLLAVLSLIGYRFYRLKKVKETIPHLVKDGAIIIDVRTSAEFSAGNNPKSMNIPLDKLMEDINRLDKSKTIILCCASGARSAAAASMLKKKGFEKTLNAGSWTNTIFQ